MMDKISSMKMEMTNQRNELEEKFKKFEMENECIICNNVMSKMERYKKRKNDVYELTCMHDAFHT